MKKLPSIKTVMVIVACLFIIVISTYVDTSDNVEVMVTNLDNAKTYKVPNLIEKPKITNEDIKMEEELPEPEVEEELVVFDGLTLNELAEKLNRSLKGKLKNQGYAFASKAMEYEVDPYLAVAIVLHETGCNGKCSTLVTKCNNVGGMKGNPGCGGGAYKKFSTLEEGIDAFMKNLSKNYIKKGLTTPEQIGKKYAGSTSWPSKIRYYMKLVKDR